MVKTDIKPEIHVSVRPWGGGGGTPMGGGGWYSLIWAIQGCAAGQGMVCCPEQGTCIQLFYFPLSVS